MKKDLKKENNKNELIQIDATDKTLGRLASNVAFKLMGKNKPEFERHKYSGSAIRVFNLSKIKISPKKLKSITHKRYSGYPGGLKIIKASKTIEHKGYSELFKLVVYQMLPDNKIRKQMMKNLVIED